VTNNDTATTTFQAHLPSLPGILGLCFTVFLLFPGYASAYEQRVPIHMLPQGSTSLELIAASTESESAQLTPQDQQLSEMNNEIFASKFVIRHALGKRWEIGAEMPFFISRDKTVNTIKTQVTNESEDEGPGDLTLSTTYRWLESQRGGMGLLTGIDLKIPTGDEDHQLGTGTWDTGFRAVASYRTPIGFPFLMGIYTWNNETERNGIETDKGNELELALGLKTAFWHGLALQVSGFYSCLTENRIREMGGKEAVFDQYQTSGFFIALRYRPIKSLELNLFHKSTYHLDDDFRLEGSPLKLDAKPSRSYGLALKYFWW